MKSLSALLLTLFVAAALADTTPSDSIYQLNIALTSQANQVIKLDVYRGQPTLITMFYGSCPNVCPLLIETLQNAERSLDTKDRTRLRVIMVSIDPDRDTPTALAIVAKNHLSFASYKYRSRHMSQRDWRRNKASCCLRTRRAWSLFFRN